MSRLDSAMPPIAATGRKASAKPPRHGGRPSRQEAERLRQTIIDIATTMFLELGYGATSIEAIAQQAHMSKRTFYCRFRDKAELFAAVVHDIVARLRPADLGSPAGMAALFAGKRLDAILLRLARIVLGAALAPQAIALQRILLAEGSRFPELAAVAMGEGSRREAITHIAALLERERRNGVTDLDQPEFAAEQFLQMVVSLPQRRAMGLGEPMSEAERELWCQQTVGLFLNGCRARGQPR